MSMDSEESRTLVKTTVFVLSHTPYKATLRLPRLSRLPKEMVAEAAAQQGCKKLVALPHGHFEVLFNNRETNYQVAVYKFRDVVGCRATNSAQHGYLPVVSPRHREIALTWDTEKIRVGFQYLYGYEHKYRIEQGKVILSQQVPVEPLNPLHENQRTVAMITSLVSALGNEYIQAPNQFGERDEPLLPPLWWRRYPNF